MKRIFLILFILLNISVLDAFSVSFKAAGPEAIPVGQPFRLVYSLDASGAKDLRIPELSEFDILAGPFKSSSSSVQIINGKVNSSKSLSYTYTVMAKKEGTYTVSPASIYVEDQKYTSNAITIRVLPSDEDASANQNNNASAKQQSSSRPNAGTNVSNENLFIRAIPSKTHLFEQDYLLITYKLYSTVDVVNVSGIKLPDFDGFLKQDIEQTKQAQFKLENYNGRNYKTVVLYQALLYPQHSGSIVIQKASFEPIIRVQTRAQVRSIFDDFFGNYQEVKKTINVPSVKISVDKLPSNKPDDFTGAVGKFKFESSISAENVAVNDPITLKYKISGNGNLKLVKNPEVDFPADFESYDPKVNNNLKNSTSGVSGSKTVEYLLIPRSQGDFVVPSYAFSYFDVNSKSYKVIKSPEYKIHVGKGNGSSAANNNQAVVSNFTNQEQLKVLGKDIRYINTKNISLSKSSGFLFGSFVFWLWYIIPLALFLALVILYRKNLKANADLIQVKNKKANKLAIKRLKVAHKYLLEQQKTQFYDEVLKALWGYLSDKLSIPVSTLSKENVVGELSRRTVNDIDINEFMDILSVCEFAQYSPSSDAHAMDTLYERAIAVISKFQESIK